MDKDIQAAMESLFTPSPLANYRNICPPSRTVTVELTQDEMCAVLQAYDHGISRTTAEARDQLDILMFKLKDIIHP